MNDEAATLNGKFEISQIWGNSPHNLGHFACESFIMKGLCIFAEEMRRGFVIL
jgi:hypothetical protein